MSKMVELNLSPDTATLRQFGFIALVGFGLLGAAAYLESFIFAFGLGDARIPVAYALGGLGALSALLSLVAPKANLPIYVGLTLLTYPIGFVLSHVIMGTLFFAIIGPVAIFFRLTGRDSMNRSYDGSATSYWSPVRPNRGKESYFKQY